MSLLLFLDCETTGLDPVWHTPWEIAWRFYRHDKGELRPLSGPREYFVNLTPDERMGSDPLALEIGRFPDRYVQSAAFPPATIVGQLVRDMFDIDPLATEPFHLVGASPWFDDVMLARWWAGRTVNARPYHYHLIDVENLAAGRLGLVAPWDSDEIGRRLGVTVTDEDRHTAAGDVAWTVRLYAAVYGVEVQDW